MDFIRGALMLKDTLSWQKYLLDKTNLEIYQNIKCRINVKVIVKLTWGSLAARQNSARAPEPVATCFMIDIKHQPERVLVDV